MLYRYEIKKHYKKILYLLLIVAVFLLLLLIKQKNTAQENSHEIVEVLPDFIRSILGIAHFDITTTSGTYFFVIQYISLIFFFYTIYLGLKTTTKINKNKTDFIYTILPRKKILIKKILAHITLITILIIKSFIIELILLLLFKEKNFTYLITTNLMLYITLLLAYSIGILVATMISSYKLSSNTIIILVLLLYIFNFLGDILNIRLFNYLSPWYYITNLNLLDFTFNYYYLSLTVILSTTFTCISVILFSKRDI